MKRAGAQKPPQKVVLSDEDREVVSAAAALVDETDRQHKAYQVWRHQAAKEATMAPKARSASQLLAREFNARLLWSGGVATERYATLYRLAVPFIEFAQRHPNHQASASIIELLRELNVTAENISSYIDWIRDTITKKRGMTAYEGHTVSEAPISWDILGRFGHIIEHAAAIAKLFVDSRKRRPGGDPELKALLGEDATHWNALVNQVRLAGAFFSKETGWHFRQVGEIERRKEGQTAPALSGSERVKRARARKRRGVVHRVSIDIYFSDLMALRDLNLIRAADEDDRVAVEEAVSAFFASALWSSERNTPPAIRFQDLLKSSKGDKP